METFEQFEPKGDGEFWKIPYRYINAIVDEENKHVRRKALSIIFNEISSVHEEWKTHLAAEKVPESGEGDSTSVTFYDEKHEEVVKLIRPLMKSITDPVERCRETAYDIMTLIIPLLPENEYEPNLPFIIPPLVDRFGEPEIAETSEEVRFTAMKFITALLEAVQRQHLLPYVDDLIQILSFLIVDPFHSVRIAACKACSYLAMKSKGVFHITSDRLLTPLCTSISHQQFRVRCAVIECLGDVVLFGNHKSIGDVLPHVTQRLFDPSPSVRKLAIAVSANWLMNYVDRYSYFHKLLPIILTGLSDESPENAELASILWKKVGEQYLKENEEEYKDETNFPKPIDVSEGPYRTVERPTFGCRTLIWRNFGNILPGVANDIKDWVISTRIKCAQILYQLILCSEDKIIMHTQKILEALVYAINDENTLVVSNAKKSAELVGYFVPLESSLPLLVTSVASSSSIGPLKVLLGVIEGAAGAGLEKEALEIGTLISGEEICQTLKPERQKVIVDILLAMVKKAPNSFSRKEESGKKFFRTGLTVLSIAKNASVNKEATEFLDKMRELNGLASIEELVSEMCGEILSEITSNSSQWTSVTPDKLIFERILSFGVLVVDRHAKQILSIMTENLGPERDPEVRLRFFALLAENLQHCPKSGCETQLHEFVKDIIEHVLTPNLVWVAGKTAGALRTAASSCILSILNADILPSDVITSLASDLTPALLSLTDDNALLTRQIACQSIEKVVESAKRKLSPDIINKIYPVMLKRLDDVSNEIRLFACTALLATFKNLPKDYDPEFYRLHITGAISTLMVHLDDDDEDIQDVIFNILLVLAKLAREDTIEACQNFRSKHRTPHVCDKLRSGIETEPKSDE